MFAMFFVLPICAVKYRKRSLLLAFGEAKQAICNMMVGAEEGPVHSRGYSVGRTLSRLTCALRAAKVHSLESRFSFIR